jgi:hypothetical protein
MAADVEFVQELHDRLAGREHVCPYRRGSDSGDGAPERSEARTHAVGGSRSMLRLARGGALAPDMKAHR